MIVLNGNPRKDREYEACCFDLPPPIGGVGNRTPQTNEIVSTQVVSII